MSGASTSSPSSDGEGGHSAAAPRSAPPAEASGASADEGSEIRSWHLSSADGDSDVDFDRGLPLDERAAIRARARKGGARRHEAELINQMERTYRSRVAQLEGQVETLERAREHDRVEVSLADGGAGEVVTLWGGGGIAGGRAASGVLVPLSPGGPSCVVGRRRPAPPRPRPDLSCPGRGREGGGRRGRC